MSPLTTSVRNIRRKQQAIRTAVLSFAVFVFALPLPSLLRLDVFQPVAAAGAPNVTSVMPNSGTTAGGDTVTIDGFNF